MVGTRWLVRSIYARYVAVFFSSSRRPSVPNHVWWKFMLRCMCMYRRAHTRIMLRCWILHLPLCLLWQPQYPCFCTFPSLGFGLFHFTSKKERGCYTPAGPFLLWVIRKLQVAWVISWCPVVRWCLVLPWDCMTSARFAKDEPRTILCNRSKRGLTGLHDSPCPASVSAFS